MFAETAVALWHADRALFMNMGAIACEVPEYIGTRRKPCGDGSMEEDIDEEASSLEDER